MGKQVFVDEHSLTMLEECAKQVAEIHPQDKELCWCPLSIGISASGLHTGWCHALRKHFKIKEYADGS